MRLLPSAAATAPPTETPKLAIVSKPSGARHFESQVRQNGTEEPPRQPPHGPPVRGAATGVYRFTGAGVLDQTPSRSRSCRRQYGA